MVAGWPEGWSGRLVVAAGPAQHVIGSLGVDDRSDLDSAQEGALASVGKPGELTGGVRVRVEGDPTLGLHGESQQALGRVEPFRTAVDLDGLVETLCRREDDIGIELGGWPAAFPGSHATGDVADDVQVRVGD